MKKLTLDLDELTVESFSPAPVAAENGTPEAFSPQTACRHCPDLP